MKRILLVGAVLTLSCGSQPKPVDPELAVYIETIRAIDNHAHPVRVTAAGEIDKEFDAMPVDNMEPSSDPVRMRGDEPALAEAKRKLFPHGKSEARRQQGDGYPAWILDQLHIETMFANRVAMGRGIAEPRFTWVPFADALLFPLNNATLAAENSDRKAFFADEDALLHRYAPTLPARFDDYLSQVVMPLLSAHRKGGAVAEKFEAAYLRALDFGNPDQASAAAVYNRYVQRDGPPPSADYKVLQDFLFRYIAAECGRLGMAVHLHVMQGGGRYFQVAGANPLLLEPVLNDPRLNRTRFVLVHGGWPFTHEAAALLTKPNVYVDVSAQSLMFYPRHLSEILREWLELEPEKVLFGTDAYPYSPEMGWEEAAWISNRTVRQALGMALTGMLRDGEVTRERAKALAVMVLRNNAKALYGKR